MQESSSIHEANYPFFPLLWFPSLASSAVAAGAAYSLASPPTPLLLKGIEIASCSFRKTPRVSDWGGRVVLRDESWPMAS